jgi:nucleotide-binding universal stress UspA family protein
MKILLAIDGSVYSHAAVEEIAKRPWPAESEVKVISVAETPIIGIEPWGAGVAVPAYFEELQRTAREAAKAVIESALVRLKTAEDKTLNVNSEIIQGSPRQVIVEEAERWGADLIVMGSRGLGAWNRLLLGSVSSSVVHHAKCSVEIVRRHATEPTDT